MPKSLLRVSFRATLADVLFHHAIEFALRFQDVLDCIAGSTVAAIVVHDDMSFVLYRLARLPHSDGQAAASHDRQVDDVIADKSNFFSVHASIATDLLERAGLVRDSLVHEVHPEVARTQLHRLRDAFRDHAGPDATQSRE